MTAYLQTRGRNVDYAFLGSAPEVWWKPYLNQTAAENPTILVHSDGQCWRVYLSGIESKRKDRVGTSIRYTLVLEGACKEEGECTTARTAVGLWLESAVRHEPSGDLQKALDSEFDEAFVEQALNSRSAETEAEARKRVESALGHLSEFLPADGHTEEPGSWVGSVNQVRAREVFSGRVRKLLGGEAGRALFLNLIRTLEEARAIAEQGEPAAILVVEEAGKLGSEIVSLKKKILKDKTQRSGRQDRLEPRPGALGSQSPSSSSQFFSGSSSTPTSAEGKDLGTLA